MLKNDGIMKQTNRHIENWRQIVSGWTEVIIDGYSYLCSSLCWGGRDEGEGDAEWVGKRGDG